MLNSLKLFGKMQDKKMNRSNSFVVNALKWLPIHYNNNNNQNHNNNNLNSVKGFGSTVAVQKLRESKWFSPEEQRIFCAVVECGFIVEICGNYTKQSTNHQSQSGNFCQTQFQGDDLNVADDDDDDDDDGDTITTDIFHKENNICTVGGGGGNSSINIDNHYTHDKKDSWFGVVICKTTKDNKPKPETIEIFSVKIRENGVRVFKMTIEDIWKNNWKIRINNFADREKHPHNDKDIKNQVAFARKAKYSLWHNTKHFAYWCRYGSRQQDIRKRQMSECVKWGSVGMNAGMMLIMTNKPKSHSSSK